MQHKISEKLSWSHLVKNSRVLLLHVFVFIGLMTAFGFAFPHSHVHLWFS